MMYNDDTTLDHSIDQLTALIEIDELSDLIEQLCVRQKNTEEHSTQETKS